MIVRQESAMIDLQEIMLELFDAGPEQIAGAVRKYGDLPVRLAMLGIASTKKEASPFFFGYPPGVFLSYKWEGEPMQLYVQALSAYLRGRGYRPFLDVENLGETASNYFAVPQFIVSLQECVFYLLLLTEKTADFITMRKHKSSWITDEYQHALRLQNAGRLLLVPLLLEKGGTTDFFGPDLVVDLTQNRYDFTKLDSLFPQGNRPLTDAEQNLLKHCLEDFDGLFLQERFSEALAVLLNKNLQFSGTFDHQFRMMLYAIYTANQPLLKGVQKKLCEFVPEKGLAHLYSGYCKQHGIPNRLVA
jgi:TIR domain